MANKGGDDISKKDWVGECAAVLLEELAKRGLTVDPREAREVISQHTLDVGKTMGISAVTARKYISDEVIAEMADSLAELLTEEAPGIDLMDEPRTTHLSQKLVGRTVAGLAEAVLFYHGRGDKRDSTSDVIRELAEHLSVFGSIVAEGSTPSVVVPPAIITRIAARLDRAANQEGVSAELAAAWRRDAMRLRSS